MTIVDSHSGYLSAIPLRSKSDACSQIQSILRFKKQKQGCFPATICSDGGGEFIFQELQSFFQYNSIQHITTEPYHHEHNGRVERANQTIAESIRTILRSSKLPLAFWAEVSKASTLMLNQIPKRPNKKSPYEIFTSKTLPLEYFHPLGSRVAYLDLKIPCRNKFNN